MCSNIGSFLLGVASLGIDATPMEGIDVKALDEEFGLREKGFTALVAVSIGYRAESDFNSTDKTPKSRLPESELFTEITTASLSKSAGISNFPAK